MIADGVSLLSGYTCPLLLLSELLNSVEFEKDAPSFHVSLAGLQDPLNVTTRRDDLWFDFRMPTDVSEIWSIVKHEWKGRLKDVDVYYRLNFRHCSIEGHSNASLRPITGSFADFVWTT